MALTGVIGCGKTVTLRRLQETLRKEGKIIVSKSLSVDRHRATLRCDPADSQSAKERAPRESTLISALFYDLSPDQKVKIPSQGERRERQLRQLIRKGKKPVALFVDEAHDLHSSTLTDFVGEVNKRSKDIREVNSRTPSANKLDQFLFFVQTNTSYRIEGRVTKIGFKKVAIAKLLSKCCLVTSTDNDSASSIS